VEQFKAKIDIINETLHGKYSAKQQWENYNTLISEQNKIDAKLDALRHSETDEQDKQSNPKVENKDQASDSNKEISEIMQQSQISNTFDTGGPSSQPVINKRKYSDSDDSVDEWTRGKRKNPYWDYPVDESPDKGKGIDPDWYNQVNKSTEKSKDTDSIENLIDESSGPSGGIPDKDFDWNHPKNNPPEPGSFLDDID
jgi:hypothetical protein